MDSVFVPHWPIILNSINEFLPVAKRMLENREKCISIQKSSVEVILSDANTTKLRAAMKIRLQAGFPSPLPIPSADEMNIDATKE
jgi:hypothetical protein